MADELVPPVASDAVPDDSTVRVQVALAARGGCRGEVVDAAMVAARRLADSLADRARVMVLAQIEDDPFPATNPLCRPFDVVLEVQADSSVGVGTLVRPMSGLGDELVEIVHRDLCAVAAGSVQSLIACEPTPLRYLYVMRRRAHTTHDEYIDYYFHRHSRFGPATPNIEGYTQFHIDAATSSLAASVVGLPVSEADSVSELLMESLEAFFAGIGDGRLGGEAAADEAKFVDRDNSVSFCTRSTVVTA